MLLIKNGYIKTMAGEDIDGGAVLIGDDGKIIAVGRDVNLCEGADEVIDAEGRLVTPGCIEAHCHIGLSGSAIRWEGAEQNEKSDPITPHMRGIDGVNPTDEMFKNAISHGITSACTGPGSSNVVGGTFVAIKLVGDCVDKMVIKNPVAMKCAFGENPKDVYGQSGKKAPITRMAIATMIRELLFKTQQYLRAKEAGKDPTFDIKLEAMIPVIKKEIPLKAHAHRSHDIYTAIRIAKEFDVLLTIDHCTDGALIKEDILASGYPAIVGPSFGRKSKAELINKGFSTVGELHKAGVSVSITTDAPITPIEYLPFCAGLAVSEGLDYNEAWKAITINPATHMGISDRVGSLEAGKDGDVVIWNADPLTVVGAKAYRTIIDGKVVYGL